MKAESQLREKLVHLSLITISVYYHVTNYINTPTYYYYYIYQTLTYIHVFCRKNDTQPVDKSRTKVSNTIVNCKQLVFLCVLPIEQIAKRNIVIYMTDLQSS